MKGRKVMIAMSFISPKYIQEGEFETLSETKEVPGKRHSRKLAAVLVAACLLFTLAVTAYATDLFGLRDMYRTPYRELPEEAADYIQKETAAAKAEEGWSCEITESLSDGTTVMATVTIRGGDQYIVVPTDADPEQSVSVIGISGGQKLREYAKEKGKTLLFVGASIQEIGGQETGGGSQRMENRSDSEMVILTQTSRPANASGQEAVCQVYALEDGKTSVEDVQRVKLPFTLNQAPEIGGGMVYHPLNPEAIPGLKVSDMTITETALGYSMRMPITVTDEEAFRELMKYKFDGITYGEGGFVMQSDDTWRFQADMCQGTMGGSLMLRVYDMDDNPMGEIDFRQVLD